MANAATFYKFQSRIEEIVPVLITVTYFINARHVIQATLAQRKTYDMASHSHSSSTWLYLAAPRANFIKILSPLVILSMEKTILAI